MSARPRPRPETGPRRRPVALAAPDNLATLAPIPFPSWRLEVGVVEWFRPGQYGRVEQSLADLEALGVHHLRTCLSWMEGEADAGREWYRWLLPRLARQVAVLPCIHAPARDYVPFVDEILTRSGRHFEYLELTTGPAPDADWHSRCEMIGSAARCAHQGGWRTVLGGLTPADADRLGMLCDLGLLPHLDVIGLHHFPDRTPGAWEEDLAKMQRLLDERDGGARIWITETGVSTWRKGEFRQCQALAEALEAPVPRAYWYSLHDVDPSLPAADGLHAEERDYHYGLKRCDGTPKLLFHLWSSGGLRRVREAARQSAPPAHSYRLIPFREAAARGPRQLPPPPVPAGP